MTDDRPATLAQRAAYARQLAAAADADDEARREAGRREQSERVAAWAELEAARRLGVCPVCEHLGEAYDDDTDFVMLEYTTDSPHGSQRPRCKGTGRPAGWSLAPGGPEGMPRTPELQDPVKVLTEHPTT